MYKWLVIGLFAFVIQASALELDAKRSSTESVTISVQEAQSSSLKECLDHGLTVRLRLEYKLCVKDKSLFPKCTAGEVILRDLMNDPVAGGVKGSVDKLGDTGEPMTWRADTVAEGWEALTRDFEILTTRKDKNFTRVRAQIYCVGEASATLSQISSIISLGFFTLGQESTGWINFNLASAQ